MELALPLACFRLVLRAQSSIRFNHYSGSAWRGLFGHALRQTACVTGQRDCSGCMLYRSCVYAAVFETPPPPDTQYMRRYNAAPHPFILTPDPALRLLNPGEETELNLVLIDRAVAQLPYLVHAFTLAGKRGVGAEKGHFELIDIRQETCPGSGEWVSIFDNGSLQPLPPAAPKAPPLPDHIELELTSPLRVKYNNRIMSTRYFVFAGVISNLLRRVSMLSYFHASQPFDTDFRALVIQAQEIVPASNQLKWFDWHRYSSRQQTKIKMSGLVGTITFSGDDLEPFWPLLWTGQWLHAGKGTSMGLGAYRIGDASRRVAGSTRDIGKRMGKAVTSL